MFIAVMSAKETIKLLFNKSSAFRIMRSVELFFLLQDISLVMGFRIHYILFLIH